MQTTDANCCCKLLMQAAVKLNFNDSESVVRCMPWELDNDRPIYLQLMERIQRDIIKGLYTGGGKLPSVRELALEAAVNPNTMQKALSELERSGLVYSQRTSGRFITQDEHLLNQIKQELASEQIRHFFENMRQLGFTDEEIAEQTEKALKKEREQ